MKKAAVILIIILITSIMPAAEASAGNLLSNGGFEALDSTETWFQGFKAYGESILGRPNKFSGVCRSPENVKSGKLSLILSADEAVPAVSSAVQSYVSTTLTGMESGASYKLSGYVKGDALIFSSFSVYSGGTNMQSIHGKQVRGDVSAWTYYETEFTLPGGADKIVLYLRIKDPGYACFDDFSLVKTSDPAVFFNEHETFYYTGAEKAYVRTSVNTYVYGAENRIMRYTLKDGENVLPLSENVPVTDECTFCFDVSFLSVTGREYTLVSELFDSAGRFIYSRKDPVYKYDRPSKIKEDGTFLQEGCLKVPFLGYHVYGDSGMKAAKAAGVNIVQGSGFGSAESAKESLDLAAANGLMVAVPLYKVHTENGVSKLVPTAHSQYKEEFIEILKVCSSHSATFGYLIADEPFSYADSKEEMYDLLAESYRIVKAYDTYRPVMIQDTRSTHTYRECAKLSDILVMHDYPVSTDNSKGITRVSEYVDDAVSCCDGIILHRKPVYFLGQSFGSSDGSAGYVLPTINQAKNILYQAAWNGNVSGLGLYSFAENGGWKLVNEGLYNGLLAFAENELKLITDEFIVKKNKIEFESREENLWLRISEGADKTYLYAVSFSDGEVTFSLPDSRKVYIKKAGEEEYESDKITLMPYEASAFLISSKGENRIANGGFENVSGQVLPGWSFVNFDRSAAWEIADESKNGKNSLKISSTGVLGRTVRTGEPIALVPGERYVFSAYLKAEVTEGSGVTLAMSRTGGTPYFLYYSQGVKNTNGAWQKLMYVFECPDYGGGEKVSVYPVIRFAGVGTVYVDCAELRLYKSFETEIYYGKDIELTKNGSMYEELGKESSGIVVTGNKYDTAFLNIGDRKAAAVRARYAQTGNVKELLSFEITEYEKKEEPYATRIEGGGDAKTILVTDTNLLEIIDKR